MEIYDDALLMIKNKFNKINLIDVGCARGQFLRIVKNYFTDVYSIGIDPLNHHQERYNYSNGDYTYYVQTAVDNVLKESFVKFYINSDDQASSLLEMDFENITNDLNDTDSKYYVTWANNLKIKDTMETKVVSLEMIIDNYFQFKDIHFLKIDAEGKDLDIVKSLGRYINSPMFISLECSSHKNNNIRIFKNGCHRDDVVPYMLNNDFEIYKELDYGMQKDNLTQVTDFIFINKKML